MSQIQIDSSEKRVSLSFFVSGFGPTWTSNVVVVSYSFIVLVFGGYHAPTSGRAVKFGLVIDQSLTLVKRINI